VTLFFLIMIRKRGDIDQIVRRVPRRYHGVDTRNLV